MQDESTSDSEIHLFSELFSDLFEAIFCHCISLYEFFQFEFPIFFLNRTSGSKTARPQRQDVLWVRTDGALPTPPSTSSPARHPNLTNEKGQGACPKSGLLPPPSAISLFPLFPPQTNPRLTPQPLLSLTPQPSRPSPLTTSSPLPCTQMPYSPTTSTPFHSCLPVTPSFSTSPCSPSSRYLHP